MFVFFFVHELLFFVFCFVLYTRCTIITAPNIIIVERKEREEYGFYYDAAIVAPANVVENCFEGEGGKREGEGVVTAVIITIIILFLNLTIVFFVLILWFCLYGKSR